MVSLLQNMRSIVSCRYICAPNHVWFQPSFKVINIWLDSDSIQIDIHNTINSWYYMSFLLTKRIIKRTHYVFTSNWIRPDRVLKFHWWYCVHFYVSKYLSYNRQSTLTIDGTKTSSTVFLDFFNQYIPNISNINPNENMSLAYQTKCDDMFSDPESDHIFSHFFLSVTYLVYFLFLLVCGNYPLTLKRVRCRNLL